MIIRLSPRQQFEVLVSQFEPIVRKAFMDAVADITSNIVLRRIVELLEKGDINGAIGALHLDPAAFRQLDDAIGQAFNGGGVDTVARLPILKDPEGYRIVIRWDARNLEAEAWLREHSSGLIRDIVADQREGVRSVLQAGLARGDNPTRTALNVVGRVNRVTGRREGGIIGLTAQQAGFVEGAREELGSPATMRGYLTRTRRDKRFDKTVLNAIKEKRALPADMIERIVGRYADSLLKLRADTIALNETMEALAASKDIAFRQQIANGNVIASAVTKKWKHTPQDHPRLQHQEMQGQTVQFDQPFIAPDGTLIPYPHAPGVPARHKLGCKCLAEYKIDFVAQRQARGLA